MRRKLDKRLVDVRHQLIEMAKEEATKLWRLARRAKSHGCSAELVKAIRDEANWLWDTGTSYPERILTWKFEYEFKYAFKM